VKTTSVAIASNLRRLARAAAMLAGALMLCAVSVNDAHALVGNGYTVWSWGTTTDETGIDIGAMKDFTCFLSGVSGNLNAGDQPGFSCDTLGRESIGVVADKFPPTNHYWLVAHGGACENQTNQQVWQNNPVNGQATCFWATSGVTDAEWSTGNNDLPVKVATLITVKPWIRQCFLSGVQGVAGVWNSGGTFARVVKRTAADSTHPTAGWYIEANLQPPKDGSHPKVDARCVQFPLGTHVTSGSVSAKPGSATTTVITSGAGVKACALTGITGAFNANNWNDGVVMNPPAQIDGNWSLTVTNGKTATWACAS